MSFLRPLGSSNLNVSALGLGSVKFGRNTGVKYPDSFTIPDDRAVLNLLIQSQELGINFIDTAPAYGNSEERIGALLPKRQDWIISTKVGEEFVNGESLFDFSTKQTQLSVERSLKRLNTDYLDIVLIHSDGQDKKILLESSCLETLRKLQESGLIRAIGMSTKTIAGGMLAVDLLDIVMLTYNLEQQDQEVVDYAQQHNKGILVKKGLMSGHVKKSGKELVSESMALIFSQAAIGSMIVGTINPEHLAQNVKIAKSLLQESIK
ncbi:aldo/keto reductase [Haliea sp. AH-315-K21]|uniref:Aldo/keto reductase n=1 Tax=SAR86 cluster bacterium TaxID=2030880 RepID=A0A2A5CHR7_9GAMM|nr:aldo/keto reductase [Haliea sp. AH-315-K21]PCJ43427.1 MAG: aldo/keto reductase [SAR86 cluster bacterium]